MSHLADGTPAPFGLIFGTMHFPAGNANGATGAFLDPVAKIPEYKVSAVKVEKLA